MDHAFLRACVHAHRRARRIFLDESRPSFEKGVVAFPGDTWSMAHIGRDHPDAHDHVFSVQLPQKSRVPDHPVGHRCQHDRPGRAGSSSPPRSRLLQRCDYRLAQPARSHFTRALRPNRLALGHPSPAKCLVIHGSEFCDGLSRAALDRRHVPRLLPRHNFSLGCRATTTVPGPLGARAYCCFYRGAGHQHLRRSRPLEPPGLGVFHRALVPQLPRSTHLLWNFSS